MSKVVTILGSVFLFGWAGLHLAQLYMNSYHGGVPLMRWETQLAGVISGAVGGGLLALVLIKTLVPQKRNG